MIYDTIKTYLEKEPRARERATRDRAMVNLLLKKYTLGMTKDTLIEFCHDFESYCRIWRKVTEENPHLRGKDYGDADGTKVALEQNYQLGLGYEPNFYAKKVVL